MEEWKHDDTLPVILAIDPGKTIGYCLAKPPYHIGGVGQISAIAQVAALLVSAKPSLVVIESFRLQPKKGAVQGGARMYASELLGHIRAFCMQLFIPVEEQPPSAKNMVGKNILNLTGAWEKTKGLPHARDAARHALYYLQRHYPIDFVRLLNRFYGEQEVAGGGGSVV